MQGSVVQMMNIDSLLERKVSLVTLDDHNARISCMRYETMNYTGVSTNILLVGKSSHGVQCAARSLN